MNLPDLFDDQKIYTSVEVGNLLGRRNYTVICEWDRKGWLPCSFRTPGGHRRYYGYAVNKFVRDNPHIHPQAAVW